MSHRFLKLPACFVPARGGDRRANLPGDPFWDGIFDASYTRPGDYIVAETGVFFIASQLPLLPVLCVRTNRTISLARPAAQTRVSSNTYGGYRLGSAEPILTKWPASVMISSQYGKPEATLPTNQPSANFNILLPNTGHAALANGDLLSDDLGRSGVLIGTEQTDLGWRLTARAITN